MELVEPKVYLVGRPQIMYDGMDRYLREYESEEWLDEKLNIGGNRDVEVLSEFMGRMCYLSFPRNDGTYSNPNITQVRKDSTAYFDNTISKGDGSILEHGMFSFVFHNVSRVFTHELVRHRVGTAISQMSMRYVRPDKIRFFMVEDLAPYDEVIKTTLEQIEDAYAYVTEAMNFANLDFGEKKKLTSALRRILPDGIATDIGWSANVRTLRHVIEQRTSVGAEVEIRAVFNEVGLIMKQEAPMLFADYTVNDDGEWIPGRKYKV